MGSGAHYFGMQEGRAEARAEVERLRAEAAWRKQAMCDAKDALACGDVPAAWDALNRHEAGFIPTSTSKED